MAESPFNYVGRIPRIFPNPLQRVGGIPPLEHFEKEKQTLHERTVWRLVKDRYSEYQKWCRVNESWLTPSFEKFWLETYHRGPPCTEERFRWTQFYQYVERTEGAKAVAPYAVPKPPQKRSINEESTLSHPLARVVAFHTNGC